MRQILLNENYLTFEELNYIMDEELTNKFSCLPSQLDNENGKRIDMIQYVGQIKDRINPERRLK